MKHIISILLTGFLLFFALIFSVNVNAGVLGTTAPTIGYCETDGNCGVDAGINEIVPVNTITTGTTFSQYVQQIVAYVLKFLAIVATLLIIYAGFNLLISIGDEEKAKKSKNIIIYALLGLFIIFLAGPITNFIIGVFDS